MMQQQTLAATVDRFEKGRAVLRFEDGQELILTKRYLPTRVKEGSVLHLEFYRAEDETKRKEDIARHLLEEILRPSDKD